jgi:Beta protein
MTITDQSYISVLRWKGAEKRAARALSADTKRTVVPLIEFVPKDFWETAEHAATATIGKEIAENWGWRNPIVVDPHLLGDALAAQNIEVVLGELNRCHVPSAIVTDPFRSDEYQKAVERSLTRLSDLDLCFRIRSIHLRGAGLDSALRELLNRFSTHPKQVHMILDFAWISPDGMDFEPAWKSLPMLKEWKSRTSVAGSFPKDLSELAANEEHFLPRGEWESWCALNEGPRLLTTFGDYTIQHPFFEEREGKGYNFSPSIRYTCGNGCVIIRGEGVQNDDGVGCEQWLGEAELLCTKSEFCGAPFCWGDTFIHDKSKEPLNPGSIKDWLAATINHHLTFVARQVREVKAPAVLPHN